jgi:hypothetical protein
VVTSPVWWVGVMLALAMLLARNVSAQASGGAATFDLVGTVTGEGGKALAGAFVAVDGSEWGSLTDEAGRFSIPDVDRGDISITVEQLGYDTLRWSGRVASGRPLELRMTPRPILLEGLRVVADRFESRRRAVPATVQWFDRTALASAPQLSVLDFVAARSGVPWVPCQGRRSDVCLLVRGRPTEPSVWVDEIPRFAGMDYLASLHPYDLYMVEVYAQGRQIRAYTARFMEHAAKARLSPIAILY